MSFNKYYNFFRKKRLINPFVDNPYTNSSLTVTSESIAGIRLLFYKVKNRSVKKRILTKFYNSRNPLITDGERLKYKNQIDSYPEPLTEGDVLDLFNPPNKRFSSFQQFINASIIDYMTIPEQGCVWRIEKIGNTPQNIHLLHNVTIEFEADKETPKLFKQSISGTPVSYGPDEIVWFWNYNPLSNKSLSLLEIASLSTEQWGNIALWNNGLFKGSFKPPILFKAKSIWTAKMVKDFYNRMTRLFSNNTLGKQFALAEGDVDVIKLFDQKDFDYKDAREGLREEIAAANKTPPALAGIYKYANYANTNAQMEILWTFGNTFKMNMFKSTIQTLILDRYYPDIICDWEWEMIPIYKEKEFDKAKIRKENAIAENWELRNELLKRELATPIVVQEPVKEDIEENEDDEKEPNPEIKIINKDNGKSFYAIKYTNQELTDMQTIFDKYYLKRNQNKIKRKIELFIDKIGKEVSDGFDNNEVVLKNDYVKEAWSELLKPDLAILYLRTVNKFRKEVDALSKGYFSYLYKNDDLYNRWRNVLPQELIEKADTYTELLIFKTLGMPDRLTNSLNGLVYNALLKNMGVQDFRLALKSELAFQKNSDALTGARTMVGMCLNNARQDSFNHYNVIETQWASSLDEYVRESHIKEHGHKVSLGEYYPVTKLLHPHDMNGDLEEIVNCRCTHFATKILIDNEITEIG